MRNKSVLVEARQIHLAADLVRLGARLQLLEAETSLSRERLVKLYKELRGVSPPKGMLPYSADWFTSLQPNIHSSLFLAIRRYLLAHTDARGIEATIKGYALYLEHLTVNQLDCVLSLTRAWTLIRFVDGHLLATASCTKCAGQFLGHALQLNAKQVCLLCNSPAHARAAHRSPQLAARGEAQVRALRGAFAGEPAALFRGQSTKPVSIP